MKETKKYEFKVKDRNRTDKTAVTIRAKAMTNKRQIFDACLITTDMKRPFNACEKTIIHVKTENPSIILEIRNDLTVKYGIATAGTRFNIDPQV